MNNNLDETHRDVYEHDKETNWDAMKMLIEEFPDGCDGDKKNNIREKKIHRFITEKKKETNQYTLGKVI